MAGDKFARTLQVSSDPDKAWETLTDVELMAGWVEIVHDVKEITHLEKYSAVLQDRVGPFKLRADLDVTAEVPEPGRHIRISASGRDRQVDSRISVSASLAITPGDAGTTVEVEGKYQITGRVAGLGAGVIKKKADRILDDFFTNAAKALG
jgi:uncharacterized protein